MQDVATISADPNFLALPAAERIKVMDQVDPNFRNLDPTQKLSVVQSSRFKRVTTPTTGPAAANAGPAVGDWSDPTKPHRFIPKDASIGPPSGVKGAVKNLGRDTVEALPDIGMTAGGLFGGVSGAGVVSAPNAIVGAGVGRMLGTSARDLFRAGGVGETPPPDTSMGELAEINKAGVQGSATEAAGLVFGNVLGGAVAPAMADIESNALMRHINDRWMTSSETAATRGLNPSDRAFQRHLPIALSEIKEAEKVIPPKGAADIAWFRRASRLQLGRNTETINQIVEPQATIVFPGSKNRIIAAEIRAIPEDIKPNVRQRLIRDINTRYEGDLTLGKLNDLRSELSATQSPFYGKGIAGQLPMEAGQRAIDIARGREVRRMFYEGLDQYGLGGGEAAAKANQRIGALIHFEDALGANANKSVATRQTLGARTAYRASQLMRPGHALEQFARGENRTVDQDLALALRRWHMTPEPISVNLEKRVLGTTGTQQDLLSASPSPLFQPPAPGVKPNASGLNPEDEYLMNAHQRSLWNNAKPPVTKGQQSLLTTEHGGGAMSPPDLFGIRQTKYDPTQASRYSVEDLRAMLTDVEDFLKKNPLTKDKETLTRNKIDIRKELAKRSQTAGRVKGRSDWRMGLIRPPE